MKIAQISPLNEAVPPRLYGGTERVVAYLTDALVDLGCDVTLFASAEAQTRARLVPCRRCAVRLDPNPLHLETAAHLSMLHDVQQRAHEFDVLHFHLDVLHFPMFEKLASRSITTLHSRQDLHELPGIYQRWPMYPLVSISASQRTAIPKANWLATVHHGLPLNAYRPSRQPRGDYLAFLGRISPEKRPDRAIAIARRAGLPLKMAAKVDSADRRYFSEHIEPLLDPPGIEMIGEIGESQKADFLGNAAALLFPIDWPEPFGLVMIEAMACGTPVIAWNCGSVSEVIDDGITGRIVDSEDAAVAAVAWARSAPRAAIRATFERRFGANEMARRYLDLYHQVARPASRLLEPPRPGRERPPAVGGPLTVVATSR
jgi:glycosyltransferase involved in cell wall biosynthesis